MQSLYDFLNSLSEPQGIVYLARFFICVFFAVLFLQSGLDKVFDRQGNLSWLTEHFSKTVFRNSVPLMLFKITVGEVLAGVLMAFGAIGTLLGYHTVAIVGLYVCAWTLIGLFLGQRIAKDYVGAAVLVPYFLLNLFSLWVFTL